MKKSIFIHQPVFFPRPFYLDTIEKIRKKALSYQGLLSIYQFGNISNPGVSDIDLLFVFEDHALNNHDPLSTLSREEKYLFTHRIGGINVSHTGDFMKYSAYSNWKCLYGSDLLEKHRTIQHTQAIKTQIALEFLVNLYISLSTQISYSAIKLRSTLQILKAVKYDLEFLNIKEGDFYSLSLNMNSLIESWFENRDAENYFKKIFPDYFISFEATLKELLQKNNLYFPFGREIRFSKNITIQKSDSLQMSHNGIRIPSFLLRLYPDSYRLQKKVLYFQFCFPYCEETPSQELTNRFFALKAMKEYNSKYLKYYMPLLPNLSGKLL